MGIMKKPVMFQAFFVTVVSILLFNVKSAYTNTEIVPKPEPVFKILSDKEESHHFIQRRSVLNKFLKMARFQTVSPDVKEIKAQQEEDGFKWELETGGQILSPLVIDSKGTVYAVTSEIDIETGDISAGKLLAVESAVGKINWEFDPQGKISGTPFLGNDNTLFLGASPVGNAAGTLFALSDKGATRWSFDTDGEIVNSPAARGDRVFAVTTGGVKIRSTLYSINIKSINTNNVTPEWEFGTDTRIESLLVMDSGIVIVIADEILVGSDKSKIFAFDPVKIADSGIAEPVWSFDLEGAFVAHPVAMNDKIFVPTLGANPEDGRVFAFSAAGEKIWEFSTGGAVLGSPVVDNGGTVFVGVNIIKETSDGFSAEAKLVAIDGNGSKKWEFQADNNTILEAIIASPVLDLSGNIFLNTAGLARKGVVGNIYSLNASSGSVNWVTNLEGAALPSPLLGIDNIIYTGITKASVNLKTQEIGDVSGAIIALDKNSGSIKNTFETKGAIVAPMILSDVSLFAGTANFTDNTMSGTLYALRAVGAPPSGGISGVISDSETGDVVVNAVITARSVDGEFSDTTLSDGSYVLGDIPVGIYTITIEADGFASKSIEGINIVDEKNIKRNEVLTPLTSTGSVAGKVTDFSTGEGITGVRVATDDGVFFTETVEDGSYKLSGLPEGIYTVEASAEGFVTSASELTAVLIRNTTFLDFVLTPPLPDADFTAQPVSGASPLKVEFSDKSTGDITEWLWVFGDGDSSIEQNSVHTYNKAGVFNVVLTVTGPGGSDSTIKPELIEVIGEPLAEFEAVATAGFVPFSVQFRDLSVGSISGWQWDFGDGNSSEEQNPSHVYETEGGFTVTLVVSGPGGSDSEIKTDYIRVLPVSIPLAEFSADKTVGFTPFSAQFNDLSGGEISSRQWDFGDGETGSEQSPLHEYKTEGDFDVTLTVNGPGGTDSVEKKGFITVLPVNEPKVDFSVDKTAAFAPLEVQFTDLSEGTGLKSWLWDFGDGAISSERSPSHEFKAEGFYSPLLTVSGKGGVGFEKKINRIIVISTGAPVAEFSATPTAFFLPQAVTFSDLSEGENISSWIWNFGDGGISAEQNSTHTYKVSGYFTVSLIVSNENGASKETKLNLINSVSVGAPLSEFRATPTTGFAPLEVTFNELAEPVDNIDSFFWDFGDGATSGEKNSKHMYTRNGFFNVNLTVSNENGANTSKKANLINVSSALPPVAEFSADKTAGLKPLEVSFKDLSTGEIDSRLWKFGDGSVGDQKNPKHTYTRSGIFFVSLTVSGPSGADVETKTNLITVEDSPPVAEFSASPTTIVKRSEVQFSDLSERAINWLWDFGDGSSSMEQNPKHVYNRKGNFTVSLTVSGPGGTAMETKTNFIIVERKKRR